MSGYHQELGSLPILDSPLDPARKVRGKQTKQIQLGNPGKINQINLCAETVENTYRNQNEARVPVGTTMIQHNLDSRYKLHKATKSRKVGTESKTAWTVVGLAVLSSNGNFGFLQTFMSKSLGKICENH